MKTFLNANFFAFEVCKNLKSNENLLGFIFNPEVLNMYYKILSKYRLEPSRINYSMVVHRDCPKSKNIFKPCDLNI